VKEKVRVSSKKKQFLKVDTTKNHQKTDCNPKKIIAVIFMFLNRCNISDKSL